MKRISDSEKIILDWIWAQGPSTSSKYIIEHFMTTTTWKQTTISTFLRRLIDKGYLTTKRTGRSFEYTPTLTREEYIKNYITSLVEKECEGSLVKLVEYYYSASEDKAQLIELKNWISERV